MHIRVLHTPQCAGSAEEAQESGFCGSPAMTIDGIDVEEDPQTPVGSMG